MKKIIKKGLIILGVYVIFTAYMFAVSDRIERLNNDDSVHNASVAIISGE